MTTLVTLEGQACKCELLGSNQEEEHYISPDRLTKYVVSKDGSYARRYDRTLEGNYETKQLESPYQTLRHEDKLIHLANDNTFLGFTEGYTDYQYELNGEEDTSAVYMHYNEDGTLAGITAFDEESNSFVTLEGVYDSNLELGRFGFLKNFGKFKLPKFKMPRIKAPRMPRMRLPKFKVPRIRMPKIKLPKFKMPKIKLPKFKMPDLSSLADAPPGDEEQEEEPQGDEENPEQEEEESQGEQEEETEEMSGASLVGSKDDPPSTWSLAFDEEKRRKYFQDLVIDANKPIYVLSAISITLSTIAIFRSFK